MGLSVHFTSVKSCGISLESCYSVLAYQVFGTDKLYWFIPAYSEEDLRRIPALQGLEYPSKPEFDSQDF